jgi:hypothetical protein
MFNDVDRRKINSGRLPKGINERNLYNTYLFIQPIATSNRY